MTRLLVVAALGLFFATAGLSHAAAQDWGSLGAPQPLAPSADTVATATQQHRIGAALVATGLTANVVGAGAAFYSFLSSFSAVYDGACFDLATCSRRDRTDWGALVVTSMVTSGVGLVLFFVGLGLDIHAHALRGATASVALRADGLTISF
jgi:hypothetical protein